MKIVPKCIILFSVLYATTSCWGKKEDVLNKPSNSQEPQQLDIPWYFKLLKAIESASTPAEIKQKLLEFFDTDDSKEVPLDPTIAKGLIRTTDFQKLFKAIDVTKPFDQILTSIKFDILIDSVNITAFLAQPNVTDIMLQSGVPVEMVKVVLANTDLKKFVEAAKLNDVVKIYMQNGDTTEKMGEILKTMDVKGMMQSINWKQIQDDPRFVETLEKLVASQSGLTATLLKTVLANMDLESFMTKQFDVDAFIKALESGASLETALMSSMEKLFKQQVDLKLIIKGFLGANSTLNMTNECQMAFKDMVFPLPDFSNINFNSVSSLLLVQHPMLQLLDSWSKIPPGIFIGHKNWLGAADQCSSIKEAKYCVARMDILGETLTWGKYGFCLPKQCTPKDGLNLVQYISDNALPGVLSMYQWTDKRPDEVICQNVESQKAYTTGFRITIGLCGLLMCLGFVGTMVDEFHAIQTKVENEVEGEKKGSEKKKTPIFVKIFTCFSIPRNIKASMSTHMPRGAVGSIMGIKVISLMWVVLGHMFASLNWAGLDNQLAIRQLIHNYAALVVMNAYPCVDTFFVVGGMLVSYLSLRRMDKTNGKLDLLMFFLHRFLRVTPLYMFIILFKTNVIPLFYETGNLGLMENHSYGQKSCQQFWWTNFLYINNFYPKSFWASCHAVSWYLANDMQFYLLAPVFLYSIYHLEKRWIKSKLRYWSGPIVLLAGVFMCFCVNIALLDYNNYPAIHAAYQLRWLLKPNPRADVRLDPQDETYDKPYTRITPYLIGMLVGYMFSRKLELKHKYKKGINVIFWIAALVTGYLCVYGPSSMYKEKPVFFSNSENLAFGSLHIIGWSLAIGWVIYSCHYGMGGVINDFLSWKAWIPLSRLTLGAYLLHSDVGDYMFGRYENRYHYQHTAFSFDFSSIIIVSFMLSFITHVLVEVPFFNLEKLMLS